MGKKTILLNRLLGNDKQTIGQAILMDSFYYTLFSFVTLEPNWQNNEVNESCIPFGEFDVVVRYSEKYGRHLEVRDVFGRTVILIHWGNFYKNTVGCILTGFSFADIDKDGYRDVTKSKRTFNRLMSLIDDEDEITLIITKTIHEV